jgi:hypothetical protein
LIKNIALAAVMLVAVALGVLAYTQSTAAGDARKKLGMAELKLQCLQWRDEYILGLMDKDDAVQTMDTCQNQFSDEQKKLIPAG